MGVGGASLLLSSSRNDRFVPMAVRAGARFLPQAPLETRTQVQIEGKQRPAFRVNLAFFAQLFLPAFPNLPLALFKQLLAPPSQPRTPPVVGPTCLLPSRRIYSISESCAPCRILVVLMVRFRGSCPEKEVSLVSIEH